MAVSASGVALEVAVEVAFEDYKDGLTWDTTFTCEMMHAYQSTG